MIISNPSAGLLLNFCAACPVERSDEAISSVYVSYFLDNNYKPIFIATIKL